MNIPSFRHDPRTGQYVPTLNDIDLPVTTFERERAIEIAQDAARKTVQPALPMKRPRHIRIYDNGGTEAGGTMDRYTVVYMNQVEQPGHTVTRKGDSFHKTEQVWIPTTFNSLGMNSQPFHGIGQHGPAVPGAHLGKRIKWEDLPEQCQQAVIQDTTP
jgi:hypothetical protein